MNKQEALDLLESVEEDLFQLHEDIEYRTTSWLKEVMHVLYGRLVNVSNAIEADFSESDNTDSTTTSPSEPTKKAKRYALSRRAIEGKLGSIVGDLSSLDCLITEVQEAASNIFDHVAELKGEVRTEK